MSEPTEPPARLHLSTQVLRFLVTGALSAVVDFGLYVLLYRLGHLPVDPAKALSFIAGTTTAYLINRRWTFQAEPSTARFIAVMSLYLVTFLVQVGLYALLMHLWSHTFIYSLLAYGIAQGTATVINFVVQRAVIFKIR